ncbi:MAG: hypothetical protein RLZ69_599, partial [Actinomycetota bacterium]
MAVRQPNLILPRLEYSASNQNFAPLPLGARESGSAVHVLFVTLVLIAV